jgi:hypothetical protein
LGYLIEDDNPETLERAKAHMRRLWTIPACPKGGPVIVAVTSGIRSFEIKLSCGCTLTMALAEYEAISRYYTYTPPGKFHSQEVLERYAANVHPICHAGQ